MCRLVPTVLNAMHVNERKRPSQKTNSKTCSSQNALGAAAPQTPPHHPREATALLEPPKRASGPSSEKRTPGVKQLIAGRPKNKDIRFAICVFLFDGRLSLLLTALLGAFDINHGMCHAFSEIMCRTSRSHLRPSRLRLCPTISSFRTGASARRCRCPLGSASPLPWQPRLFPARWLRP